MKVYVIIAYGDSSELAVICAFRDLDKARKKCEDYNHNSLSKKIFAVHELILEDDRECLHDWFYRTHPLLSLQGSVWDKKCDKCGIIEKVKE